MEKLSVYYPLIKFIVSRLGMKIYNPINKSDTRR